jgi:NAD(P)H-flavin reductase
MQVAPDSKSHLPPTSQQGLSEPEKDLGYFLSCSCIPSNPITVQLPSESDDSKLVSTIYSIHNFNEHILRLRINAPLDYRPGQYINLTFKDHLGVQHTRSYSLASVPKLDGFLELHVKALDIGVFGQWIKNAEIQTKTVEIQGPVGHCFYSDSITLNQPSAMILAGLGTGLAPLYGIVRDALNQGFDKPIYLVSGAKNSNDLYLQDELKELAKQYTNLQVQFIALEGDETNELKIGNIYDHCKNIEVDFSKTYAFLCGAQTFVGKLKKQLFLSGTPMKNILSDPFLPAANV